MEKGLRRLAAATFFERLKQKQFFKSWFLHAPAYPFPLEMLPACYLALTPVAVRPETANDIQNDFRFSVVALVFHAEELDLVKCDAADEIEEVFRDLQQDPEFMAVFSQIELETVDPGPLSLSVFGFDPLVVAPPVGAVRLDFVLDFHYSAVTS